VLVGEGRVAFRDVPQSAFASSEVRDCASLLRARTRWSARLTPSHWQDGALVVSAFPTAYNNRTKILALAARHKIPTIYPQSQYAYEGGLMSYSPVINLPQIAVDYIVPILKGAKPADLPVQRPTKYQLVINLKTAKALGLDVPAHLLVAADEVIE
jgi:putative tryptophan/tyrosine transport system substrate-binding protein